MSIVEFALVVPVLLAFLMGILEFGLATRNNLMLANAAREGARTLALGRTTASARSRMKSMTTALNLQDSSISFTYSTDDGTTYAYSVGDNTTQNTAPGGSMVKVAVNYPYKPLTNFFPFFSNFRLKTNAVMRREG